MKKLALILMLAIPLGTVGCKPAMTTTSPNTIAPIFYSGAATAMNGFSTTLMQAQSLFTTAYQEQLIDATSYQNGQKVFLQIATSAEAVDSALSAGAPQTQITTQINALISQIGTVPQAFAIKDAQSQAAFTSLMNSLVNILKATEASIPTK